MYCDSVWVRNRGQGRGPVLASGDVTNIILLMTSNGVIQIGCMEDQTADLRNVLRCKFRACSGRSFGVGYDYSDCCDRGVS